MDPILALLLGVLVGVALGAVIGMLVARTRAQAAAAQAAATATPALDPAIIEARHAAVIAETRAELGTQLAAAQSSVEGLRAQLDTAQTQYRDLLDRTRDEAEQRQLAEREEARKKLAQDQAESKVLQALTPVQETLRTMQQKVTDLETQRQRQHGELAEQLRAASESDERLRSTTESLASALNNNATRGVWGETQLRSLVENAGLLNRVDFDVQASITAESGSRRPDMVINLPGGKSIAIDAKVPYNSYIDASAIPATATGAEEARRSTLLTQHAKQVKGHVDALAGKTYWTGLESSPEFTIAFIPNESLLSSALEKDPSLLEYAFSKRIALASPVSLWAVLKTVAFTWQQDVLTDQAKDLFDLGKEMYGRLGTLADHAEKLRRSIESTVSSYNQFASSLESRVLVTARKMDQLDESKVLPTPKIIDSDPKRLNAVEFELHALDTTGVVRPELDLGLLEVAPENADEASA